jgi:hypothetical protein
VIDYQAKTFGGVVRNKQYGCPLKKRFGKVWISEQEAALFGSCFGFKNMSFADLHR